MIGHEMIGEWTNHLWQSTLFAVAAALVTLAFRKNRAHVRYCLWLSASVKFLVPFALLMNLGNSLWTAFAAKKFAAELAPPAVSLTVLQIAEPFPQTSPFTPAASLTHTADWIPIAILSVWICGFLAVVLVRYHGWLRIRSVLRASTPIDIQAAAAVRSSPGLLEPGVVGVLRPVLLLPEGILKRLPPSQLEAVIAHELSHIKRRDNLTAAIHMVVEAVFWFHPFVWWIGARLVEERERACDEAVLSLGGEPRDYADAIVSVCKLYVESPLICVSGISGADLKKRIVRIMARHVGLNMSLGKKLLLLAVALVAIAVPVVLGQAQAARRMMLAAVASAPKPVREWAAAHAMIELEQAPLTGLLAEVQGATEIPSDAKPFAFDVVSIRPADPNDHGRHSSQFTDDGFVVGSQSLEMMLMLQYPELQADSSRIVGGGDWVRTLTWDIRAKVADSDISAWSKLNHDSSAAAKKRHDATIRAMLADRFKLKTHFETREGTVYALVVGKDGPKLKPSASDAPERFTMHGQGHISFEHMAVGSIMSFFAQELRHPAIDKTGLTGKYDMTLDWTPTQGAAAAPGGDAAQASDSAAPSLFTAVQEQLGLKLEAQKGPVEHLVIDSAVKPSVDGAEVPDASIRPVAKPVAESAGTQSRPQYEAATIKPSKGPGPDKKIGLWAASDGFSAWFITPQQLISAAYGVKSFEISGGPNWLPSERFDIEAKMDAATADALAKLNKDQRALAQQQMLQALLADRFQLTVHRETKELPIYTLVIAKGGPKLQEAKPGDTYTNGYTYPDGTHAGAGSMSGSQVSGDLTAQAVRIARLVQDLTLMLGHPVSDKTELKGVYDFKLRFTPDDRLQPPSGSPPNFRFPPPPADSNAPSLFVALQEQLGLKLESGKGPVEVIVIDHVERPSEN